MFTIRQYTEADKNAWDTYVRNHPQATLYHLSGWKRVIEKTYGHKTYYLMATKEELKVQCSSLKGKGTGPLNPSSNLTRLRTQTDHSQPTTDNRQHTPANPVGLLPLVHLKHFLFGNNLISIPFFDIGGILC